MLLEHPASGVHLVSLLPLGMDPGGGCNLPLCFVKLNFVCSSDLASLVPLPSIGYALGTSVLGVPDASGVKAPAWDNRGTWDTTVTSEGHQIN